MSNDNLIFLEVIEWLDKTGDDLIYRIPEKGSGEIKFGAQLIVRESQAAVFFYNGKAYDAFGAGRHTLKTANIPVLTKILSLPWGMTSPLRAEVYFANMKIFPDLKWGTKDPVAFRDSQLGLIRLRAFGIFNIRIIQPILFINSLVGTKGIYSTSEIAEYINRVIVSRFNDFMGEKIDTIFDLPGQYEELADGLKKKLEDDLNHFGLALTNFYITSITPPPEVQKAIDDRSRLEIFDDLNSLIKMKAAMALEDASETQGAAGAGLGMGMGLMMPAMFADVFKGNQSQPQAAATCPECGNSVLNDAKFCSHCGHQLLVFKKCLSCGKNLTPGARFCSRCGEPAEEGGAEKVCPHCQTENLPESVFCNQCGERL